MPNEPQDLVTEARDFVVTSALYKNPNRARGFIEALCDEIERLRGGIRKTLDENGHLADGDDCTLIHLKRTIGEK